MASEIHIIRREPPEPTVFEEIRIYPMRLVVLPIACFVGAALLSVWFLQLALTVFGCLILSLLARGYRITVESGHISLEYLFLRFPWKRVVLSFDVELRPEQPNEKRRNRPDAIGFYDRGRGRDPEELVVGSLHAPILLREVRATVSRYREAVPQLGQGIYRGEK